MSKKVYQGLSPLEKNPQKVIIGGWAFSFFIAVMLLKSRFLKTCVLFGICAALGVAFSSFMPALQRQTLALFSVPLQSLWGISSFIEDMSDYAKLRKKLVYCEEKILLLEAELLVTKDKLRDYQKKEQLPKIASYRWVPARILSVHNTDHTALMTATSQMRPGQVILNTEGVVGRIHKVGGNIARIKLLTHPDFRLPVLGEKSQQQCILSGGDDPNKLLLLYQQNMNPLHSQERLVTSGYGGLCPSGHPVGLWKNEHITPIIDKGTLDHVLVILEPSVSSASMDLIPSFDKEARD